MRTSSFANIGMLLFLILATALSVHSVSAQAKLWEHVLNLDRSKVMGQIEAVTPSKSQLLSIATLIKSHKTGICIDDPAGEWLKNLRYEKIRLSQSANVILVEAGPGCARGGQGSNGAMWLIRFDGNVPVLIASPEEKFSGFVYSIEPSVSKRYRDIIVGWHMSAFETHLTYFQFDGKVYRSISSATLRTDEQGVSKVTAADSSRQ